MPSLRALLQVSNPGACDEAIPGCNIPLKRCFSILTCKLAFVLKKLYNVLSGLMYVSIRPCLMEDCIHTGEAFVHAAVTHGLCTSRPD